MSEKINIPETMGDREVYVNWANGRGSDVTLNIKDLNKGGRVLAWIGKEGAQALVDTLIEHFDLAPKEAPLPEPEVRHIVFTGPFEEFWSMDDVEARLEELLDAGHESPTAVNAMLDGNGEVLGLTARKVIDVTKAGEIR